MSHSLTISDEQYEELQHLATQKGVTVDAMLADVLYRLAHPIFTNEDDWFRHLGATEEEIAESTRLAALEDSDDDADA